MRYIEKTQLIERIDGLIQRKATGSATELASRVGVSKSTIYELIEVMKMMGAEIAYCCDRKSYYYTSDKVLAIGFVDKGKIKGGKSLLCPVFSDTSVLHLQHDASRDILRTL